MNIESLEKSALLVIDMQRYFLEPGARAFLEGAPPITENVRLLIDAFRKAGLPVIFTRHAHKRGESTGQMGRWWKDKLPWEDGREAQLIEGIAPAEGEMLITKNRYSVFEGTELMEALERQGANTLVLCGVTTNLCVETTARHAFVKDIQPIVVEDACAAKTPEYHQASILNLSYGFAHIETTRSIVSQLEKTSRP
jgi:nicotinamidase-related amidase